MRYDTVHLKFSLRRMLWGWAWKLWGWIEVPFAFVHYFMQTLLHDMWYYKHTAPERYKIQYRPTPFMERVKTAWHAARFGVE